MSETVLEGTTVAEAADNYIKEFMSNEASELFDADVKKEDAVSPAEDADEDADKESEADEGESAPKEDKSDEADTSIEPEEAESLETLTELAEKLEVPFDDFMASISTKFRAAGKEHTATLAELVKGYQLQTDYNRSKEALATTRKQLEQDHRERAEAHSKQLTELGAHFKVADDMLNDRAGNADLANLKEVNPGEYAVRVLELNEKRQALHQKWQEVVQQNEAAQTQNQNKFYAAEIAKVEEKVDDWGPEKSNQFIDAVRAMGFEDAEIPNLIDHRVILSVLEMQSLREKVTDLQSRLEAGKNTAAKVKKVVPKMMKPGKDSAKVTASTSALARARRAVKKNPSARNMADVWALESEARDKK